MAERIRFHDWNTTPLGAIDGWPQSLKTAIDIMLASPSPVSVLWGPDRLQLYNDAYVAIAGERHPAALGRKVADNWREAYEPSLMPIFERVVAGETVTIDEHVVAFHNRIGDVEDRYFTGAFIPLRGETGAVEGVFHPLSEVTGKVRAGRDVTDRKTAEERLRASEELNRRVLQSSADCIKVLDLDARIEFMSEGGMCVMEVDDFGLIAGAFWPEFWSGEEQGRARAAVASARAGSTGRFQGFATTMKGSPRWWDVVVTAINGDDGKPEKLLSISRDISLTKAAEARLHDLNETLEQQVVERTAERDRMWDTSPDLMVVVDFQGVFRRVNPAWTRLLGYAPADLVDHHVNEFVIPDDHNVTVEAYERAATGEPVKAENRYRHKDGSLRWISWVAAPAGDLTYATGRDVTAERQRQAELEDAQEQLRQSQKMEAIGQLTGGVAHDFNNLLTPILGSLDLLARKGLGGDRERRLIDGALQSAERAKTLVQRLLAFARRQPLQPSAVDLSQLVPGMVELIGSTLGPTITVRVELAPDLPPANADPHQLEMALLNLAVNARDAMPEGGDLVIAAELDEVRPGHGPALSPGPYIRLIVRDTGVGMDEATRQRAVEPFFSTKGIGKGTGLGLSMVHGLAAQLGGGMMIESRPGQGTTIELWLSIGTNVQVAADEPSVAAPALQGKGRVLLVDDEEFVRLSTADMLTDFGYQVIEASSAEEALLLVEGGFVPDLLVTDHLMSGLSGTRLAHALRAELPDLPVLIMSGYAEADGIDPAIPRLTKPFRHSELTASLQALVADE